MLTVDLRAASTSSGTVLDEKHVLFTGGIGDTVTMDVWAVITGFDPNNHNPTFLDFLHGSFLSSFGGLLSDLKASTDIDWLDTFGSHGVQQDLDDDIDLDVGSNNDASGLNFFRAYLGQFAPIAPVVHIARVTWTPRGAIRSAMACEWDTLRSIYSDFFQRRAGSDHSDPGSRHLSDGMRCLGRSRPSATALRII